MDAAVSFRSIRNNFLLRTLVVLTFLDAVLTTIILEWKKVEEANPWLAYMYATSPVLFVATKFAVAFLFIKILDRYGRIWTERTYLCTFVLVLTIMYACLVAAQGGFLLSVSRSL